MGRVWSVILVFSLAVNLLLIGVFVGHRIGSGGRTPPSDLREEQPLQPEHPMALVHSISSLPMLSEEDRMTIRRALRSNLPDLKKRSKLLAEARREAMLAFTSEPFDRPAYDSATARIRTLEAAQAEDISNALAEALLALPEDRRVIVQKHMRQRAMMRASMMPGRRPPPGQRGHAGGHPREHQQKDPQRRPPQEQE